MSEDQIKFGGKPRFFNKNKEGGNSTAPVEAPQRNGGGNGSNDGGNVEAKPFYPKPAAPQGGNCKQIHKHTLLNFIFCIFRSEKASSTIIRTKKRE